MWLSCTSVAPAPSDSLSFSFRLSGRCFAPPSFARIQGCQCKCQCQCQCQADFVNSEVSLSCSFAAGSENLPLGSGGESMYGKERGIIISCVTVDAGRGVRVYRTPPIRSTSKIGERNQCDGRKRQAITYSSLIICSLFLLPLASSPLNHLVLHYALHRQSPASCV